MSGTTRGPMGPADWLLLVKLSVLWGGSFLFTGIAVREVPPLTLVTLRIGIAAVALLALIRAMGLAVPTTNRFWSVCFGMGVLNNVVPFNLSAWAQTQIPSGLAAILNATTPLFAVLVTHALTDDEKATGPKIAGVACGFAGVAVMIGPDVFSIRSDLLPQLAVLGCALSYAFSGVFGRRFKALGQPPVVAAAGQLTASTAMLLPVMLLVDQPWAIPVPGTGTLAAILALSLASTAFAYILFFRILASAGAMNLMLVTFLIPISAVMLGALVLGERLEAKHVAGMALIALGLAAIDGRAFAWLRHRSGAS